MTVTTTELTKEGRETLFFSEKKKERQEAKQFTWPVCAHRKMSMHAFRSSKSSGTCAVCKEKLRGIVTKGVKCSACGMRAHQQCAEKVPADCPSAAGKEGKHSKSPKGGEPVDPRDILASCGLSAGMLEGDIDDAAMGGGDDGDMDDKEIAAQLAAKPKKKAETAKKAPSPSPPPPAAKRTPSPAPAPTARKAPSPAPPAAKKGASKGPMDPQDILASCGLSAGMLEGDIDDDAAMGDGDEDMDDTEITAQLAMKPKKKAAAAAPTVKKALPPAPAKKKGAATEEKSSDADKLLSQAQSLASGGAEDDPAAGVELTEDDMNDPDLLADL
jgi:hypothetical protein